MSEHIVALDTSLEINMSEVQKYVDGVTNGECFIIYINGEPVGRWLRVEDRMDGFCADANIRKYFGGDWCDALMNKSRDIITDHTIKKAREMWAPVAQGLIDRHITATNTFSTNFTPDTFGRLSSGAFEEPRQYERKHTLSLRMDHDGIGLSVVFTETEYLALDALSRHMGCGDDIAAAYDCAWSHAIEKISHSTDRRYISTQRIINDAQKWLVEWHKGATS